MCHRPPRCHTSHQLSLCSSLVSEPVFVVLSYIFHPHHLSSLTLATGCGTPTLHLFSTVKKTCPTVIHELCDKLQTVLDFSQGNVLLLKQCFAVYFGNLMVHYSPESVSNDTFWFGIIQRAYPLINFLPFFISKVLHR